MYCLLTKFESVLTEMRKAANYFSQWVCISLFGFSAAR